MALLESQSGIAAFVAISFLILIDHQKRQNENIKKSWLKTYDAEIHDLLNSKIYSFIYLK